MSDALNAGGVSVILRSDDYESVHYGLALAAAALAVNKPAHGGPGLIAPLAGAG